MGNKAKRWLGSSVKRHEDMAKAILGVHPVSPFHRFRSRGDYHQAYGNHLEDTTSKSRESRAKFEHSKIRDKSPKQQIVDQVSSRPRQKSC